MCTIVLLRDVHPDWPLVIAANRDEIFARNSLPPLWFSGTPGVLGGMDQVGGGTWLGTTQEGFFAAVTNQRTWKPPNPGLDSRGQLVLDVTRQGSPGGARELLEALDARRYNPFHVVFGDSRQLYYGTGSMDGASVLVEEVPAGIHILGNEKLNESPPGSLQVLRTRFSETPAPEWLQLQNWLQTMLSDHTRIPESMVTAPPPDSPISREQALQATAVCVHGGLYGTRSATIVALTPRGVARYLHAEGPPCSTPFVDALWMFRDRQALRAPDSERMETS
ncbi:MAG: NRDE family protein [Myxococcota bacterium]|jgi:uncharacterized protein with NRDE domain|nr:NRDE family protein [Myxococcota bacterium]